MLQNTEKRKREVFPEDAGAGRPDLSLWFVTDDGPFTTQLCSCYGLISCNRSTLLFAALRCDVAHVLVEVFLISLCFVYLQRPGRSGLPSSKTTGETGNVDRRAPVCSGQKDKDRRTRSVGSSMIAAVKFGASAKSHKRERERPVKRNVISPEILNGTQTFSMSLTSIMSE